MAIKTRHPLYYFLAGLSMGALILTKAAFLYISLALVVCFAFWLICRWRHGIRWGVIGLLLFVFGVTVVVAPWMGRNYYLFGTASVSERGGGVLMMRALKDQMSWTECLGSFYVWAPEGSIRNAVGKTLGFNEADLNKGGRLQRLNRDSFAEDLAAEEAGLPEAAISYYAQARAERVKLNKELQQQGVSHFKNAADVELQKHAMELILAHPIRHLFMTVPFLWRGAPFIAPLLAFFATIAIRRRRYDLIAYMLPAIAMVAFYAMATHNIPRYNVPAQPIVAVLIIDMTQALIIRIWQRLSRPIKSRV
jgi:4-amino-4-deoxy-L-arabinose transferase-like glycosyltransferase